MPHPEGRPVRLALYLSVEENEMLQQIQNKTGENAQGAIRRAIAFLHAQSNYFVIPINPTR